jgi:hypothetical protein
MTGKIKIKVGAAHQNINHRIIKCFGALHLRLFPFNSFLQMFRSYAAKIG